MLSIRLSELGRFSEAYLEVAEGNETGSRRSAGPKEMLLTARKAARPIAPSTNLVDVIKQETPQFARSAAWQKSVETLAVEKLSLILSFPRIGCLGGSIAQLLKCMTAARLAQYLELEGLPAVPFCWSIMQDDRIETSIAGDCSRHSSTLQRDLKNLIRHITYPVKFPNNNEDIGDGREFEATAKTASLARGVLMWIGRDFGWLIIDSESERLGAIPGASSSAATNGKANSLLHKVECPGSEGAGRGIGGMSLIAELASDLPIAAIVIGPDDYPQASRIADRVESAGYPRPVLFPRLSATVVDRRNWRIMRKYALHLADLFARRKALQARFERDLDISTIAGRIDTLVRSAENALGQLADGLADRARVSRKIRSRGSRISFQLRKVEVRARAAFEERRLTRDRQVERLRKTVAPGGGLQEDGLSVVEFLERFPPAALSALYQRADIWNHRHQLICLDGET